MRRRILAWEMGGLLATAAFAPFACSDSSCDGPGGLCIEPPGGEAAEAGSGGVTGGQPGGGTSSGRGGTPSGGRGSSGADSQGGSDEPSPQAGDGGESGAIDGGEAGLRAEGGEAGLRAEGGAGGSAGEVGAQGGGSGERAETAGGAGGTSSGSSGTSSGSAGTSASGSGGAFGGAGGKASGGTGGKASGGVAGFEGSGDLCDDLALADFSDTCLAGTGGAGGGAGGGSSVVVCELESGNGGVQGSDAGAAGQSQGGEGGSPGPTPDSGLFLIDDLEDGDDLTHQVLGALGAWFTANDGSGSQFPTACFKSSTAGALGPRASAFAMHTYGTGFQDGGYAQVGISFRSSPPACDQPVDASAMTGVRFWVYGAHQLQVVRLTVATVATQGVEHGGTCLSDCYNGHFQDVPVGQGWNEVHVGFAMLEQLPWGERILFNPATILNLTWEAETGLGGDQAACFDFWLDDVAFFKDR